MNTKIWIAVAIVVLVVVGVLVNMIGGVSIRSNDTSLSRIAIQAPDPLSPGQNTIIRWATPSSVISQQVSVMLRSKQGSASLLAVPFFAGNANIHVPCEIPAGQASLELASVQDKSLIAWKTVTITHAGPDCVR